MTTFRAFVVTAFLALAACDRAAQPGSYQSLASLDALRASFNADTGKVRAIFLASPT